MPRAVAMFSGGLDSSLAVRVMQNQGFEVDALYVRTPFCSGVDDSAAAARSLGIRHTVRDVGEDYVEVLCRPRYGYGSAMNPCIDCRIYMARMAREFMEELGASFVISGEILSQRPMSQKRHHLALVAQRSGLEGRLLRPLCALHLEPTLPELSGEVDRQRLYRFDGRGRRPLLELAEQLGVTVTPTPSTGCALTERSFAPRVQDLIQFTPDPTLWDFALLRIGRHTRLADGAKAIVGRDQQENASLRAMAPQGDPDRTILLEPANFLGPDALLVGPDAQAHVQTVATMIVRHTRQVPEDGPPQVRVTQGKSSTVSEASMRV
ncbi:MAG: hypothetical protein JW818_15265 [Pirellulales bacterium]|nr:hypothetical protein [Pirellulales bacterium]